MTAALARAMMSLAARCLVEARRGWSLAMREELEVAITDGRPLAFAAGCLIAAWREMLWHEEGRFVLANYALAVGLLVPTAALQFTSVAGMVYLPLRQDGLNGVAAPSGVQSLFLAHAYPSALPVLLGLRLVLGLGHLRLAWFLVERDWSRVANTGALTVAASMTLVIFTSILFLDDVGVALQAAVLTFELAAIYVLACWNSGIATGALPIFVA